MLNNFQISFLGEALDVDALVALCPLTPDRVWRRGEPRGGAGHTFRNSGVTYPLGDGTTVPFPQQQALAIEFLKQHRDVLKAMSQHTGVTDFALGLHYAIALTPSLRGFALCLSTRLIRHLDDVGCELVNYADLRRPDDD